MILKEDILRCESIPDNTEVKEEEYLVSTDSRSFEGSNLFISLYGENFDSIDFIKDVFDKGCKLAFIERRQENKAKLSALIEEFGPERIIIVNDIFKFILELGRSRSIRFQRDGGVLIGLTGSNGKTTNKEMIKQLLGFFKPQEVWATKGNLNNQIGVPLTLFGLQDDHKVAVVEMGTSFPGEISVLAKSARPKYGFITNIGHAHIEFLGNLEGVFKEKSALFEEIVSREDGLFIVNCFDNLLSRHNGKKHTKSLTSSDVEFSSKCINIKLLGVNYKIENPHLLGKHQKINMAMCLTLLSQIFPKNIEEVVENAKKYSPPGMNRGEVISQNDKVIYLDAYNANPSSMEASLNGYAEFLVDQGSSTENCLIVLGDMNELGEEAPALHRGIGQKLKSLSPASAFFVGRYSQYYAEGYGEGAITFESTAKLKEFIAQNGWPQVNIFIKGSRSLQLESIIDITG